MNENKVCIDLIIPELEQRYNVFIPKNKKTLEVIYLLNKAINDISQDNFPIKDNLSLINGITGEIYNVDNTIYANNILNGTKLILI